MPAGQKNRPKGGFFTGLLVVPARPKPINDPYSAYLGYQFGGDSFVSYEFCDRPIVGTPQWHEWYVDCTDAKWRMRNYLVNGDDWSPDDLYQETGFPPKVKVEHNEAFWLGEAYKAFGFKRKQGEYDFEIRSLAMTALGVPNDRALAISTIFPQFIFKNSAGKHLDGVILQGKAGNGIIPISNTKFFTVIDDLRFPRGRPMGTDPKRPYNHLHNADDVIVIYEAEEKLRSLEIPSFKVRKKIENHRAECFVRKEEASVGPKEICLGNVRIGFTIVPAIEPNNWTQESIQHYVHFDAQKHLVELSETERVEHIGGGTNRPGSTRYFSKETSLFTWEERPDLFTRTKYSATFEVVNYHTRVHRPGYCPQRECWDDRSGFFSAILKVNDGQNQWSLNYVPQSK
jgi:hypothetical protein